jgi:hypothetical protein
VKNTTHEEYLKIMLRDKKLKLEHLQMKQQVDMAIFETKRDMLIAERDSIEKQLADNNK